MINGKGFASDNNAGVHPRIMQAMAQANSGHTLAYGSDAYTESAKVVFRRHFGEQAEVFFVFLGTGANVLALKALARPHNAVICPVTAHINVDECGAPEQMAGCKLLAVPTPDGKLRPGDVEPLLRNMEFEHHSRPKVVSITQSTELGTVYQPEEIEALADLVHDRGLYLHMDGARLANAAAALGTDLGTITGQAGVDALSFGGTKNGMMYGEAVVFFDPALAEDFKYIRKQGMQLASKMRFISAQFEALLNDGLWLENARHANAMARLLAQGLGSLPGVEIARPVETNAVFACLPRETIPALQQEYPFYVWNPERSEARLMASYDTTREDVQGFLAALQRLLT